MFKSFIFMQGLYKPCMNMIILYKQQIDFKFKSTYRTEIDRWDKT